MDFFSKKREELEGWIRAGDITVLENITDGFANTPRAFCELMSGKTVGKALVKVDLQGE